MKPSIENIRTIVSVLTAEERQLLKDTFLYGGWGDTDYEFLDENGNDETVGAWGYCTNDARYVELIYGTGDKICKRAYFTADEFAKVVEAIKQFNDKK